MPLFHGPDPTRQVLQETVRQPQQEAAFAACGEEYTVRAEFIARCLASSSLESILFVRSFVRSFVRFFSFLFSLLCCRHRPMLSGLFHIFFDLSQFVVSRKCNVYACGLGNVGQLGDGQSGETHVTDHCSR